MTRIKWFKNKLRGARSRLYKPFRPQKPLLKQVEFRDSSFLVLANEDIGWRLIVHKEYEQNEIKCLERLIYKDDVCVDVGANVGIYSVFMARKAYEGQVIAFEPVPLNRKILATNLALNEITNVQISDSLLSDAAGVVEFSISEDSAYSSIRPTNRKKEALTLNAQTSTLDELFHKKNQKIDVIKVDVEGAELLVLKGGEKLLSTPALRPRTLLVELDAQNQAVYDYRPEDVVEYMQTLSYSVYSVADGKLIKGWLHERGMIEAVFKHDKDEV